MDSRNSKTYVALSSFSTCFPCKNMKMSYRIKKIKISATTWNDKFELPDGSYSVSDIQN